MHSDVTAQVSRYLVREGIISRRQARQMRRTRRLTIGDVWFAVTLTANRRFALAMATAALVAGIAQACGWMGGF